MHENHMYNLMSQIVQEHRSLWRIKNHYQKDAQGCESCEAFWQKMEKDKEDHVAELTAMIKNHLS